MGSNASFWVAALGSLGMVGCLAHVVLGEVFILRPLRPESLPSSFLGDCDITKRYLRWFWHVGSLFIGGGSLALVALGADYDRPTAPMLARLIGLAFMGTFAAFCIVALPRPLLFLRVPQGLGLGLGGLAIWLLA